ncbi:hypothetical protein EGJ45_07410 [Stutzerimonas stutzeri]|uniref:plasmid replication protein, CyRepA1 family n=1 Tax=Stutzerimonas stutzeri TaxID=316 RepID=UPI000F7916B4|nr:plasmid replication protein, CyRepA1 family [Stutzerimonas stutzeri]RRW19696.1 hypothetical protein EGJ45_07410 [Stutzerimonas stutzeri]RRW25346.1 hypothetical protein EGJ36_09570 [Stutzerimonas stutzeri]
MSLLGTLSAAGYGIDSLPAHLIPGKFYRLPAPGRKKDSRDGWVKLIDDTLAVYGDWSTGEQHTWRAEGGNRRPANDNRPRRAARPEPDRSNVVNYVRQQWERAHPANDNHPYLKAKGVRAYGLRTAADGRLLVPVHHAETGELMSLQRIADDGAKQFAKGGATAGGCFLIPGSLPRIFCEGYATAATVHAATGRAAVVCFNAGNLPNVARVLAEPGDVVAADNDNAEKPGALFGRKLNTYGAGHKAAMATGLPWYMPHTPGQDWNDAGTDAVAAAFAGEPTSAAPIFDAWTLHRVELKGTTAKQWAAQLGAVTEAAEAAATAYTVAARLFLNAPAQFSLAQVRAFVEQALPVGLVHPDTLDRIMQRLDSAMQYRKAAALEAISVPPEALARHRHEVCAELTDGMLQPGDYEGVIVLWAPMGSGKTQRVGKPFVAWAKQQSTALAVCHRVSLVEDLAKHLDCDHYGEVPAAAAFGVTALATCLPSITLSAHAPIIDRAEYVFIDEIAQVLRFLESDTHCRTAEGNNEQVYQRLRDLVSRARCVIVADAGVDARTVEFLEACRPGERFRIIEMPPKREGIEARYHVGAASYATVVGECLGELAAGGRVWISTSKRKARSLEAFFSAQGYRVMAVHADNKGDPSQTAFLADPEAESLNYDVVVHSPVIGSGLSIEHKEAGPWFTLGVLIDGGHRITPADAAQMMRRVRYLRRYALALIPNSQIGKQSPESVITAWQEAAALEGKPAAVNDFAGFRAGIVADYDNHRADFAAGLLWQLERNGWTLRRGAADADAETAAALTIIKEAQDAEHRAALLAAPVITDDQARRIEAMPNRTSLQAIILEAHRIRGALGIEVLDDEALDFWDNGAAVRRMDRFSAWRGIVPAFDDSRESLARRRFWKATAKAYSELFAGIDLASARITEADASVILQRVVERRHLQAHLGIVPKTYGVWMEDKAGNLLPFKMPKNPRQELACILERMGLSWKRREGSSTLTPPETTLDNLAKGEGKPARVYFYQVTAGSLETMATWTERRNAARRTVQVEAVQTADVWHLTEDDRFWLNIRRQLNAKVHQMTLQQAEALILAHLNSRGSSYGAKVTAMWFKTDYAQRCAA